MKHLAAEPVGRLFRYQLVVGVLIGALLGAILGAYLVLPAIEQGMAVSVASVVVGLAYGGVFGVLLAAAPILGAALLLSFVEKRRPGSSGWRQARLSAMGAGLGAVLPGLYWGAGALTVNDGAWPLLVAAMFVALSMLVAGVATCGILKYLPRREAVQTHGA